MGSLEATAAPPPPLRADRLRSTASGNATREKEGRTRRGRPVVPLVDRVRSRIARLPVWGHTSNVLPLRTAYSPSCSRTRPNLSRLPGKQPLQNPRLFRCGPGFWRVVPSAAVDRGIWQTGKDSLDAKPGFSGSTDAPHHSGERPPRGSEFDLGHPGPEHRNQLGGVGRNRLEPAEPDRCTQPTTLRLVGRSELRCSHRLHRCGCGQQSTALLRHRIRRRMEHTDAARLAAGQRIPFGQLSFRRQLHRRGTGENDPAFTTEPIYAREANGTWGPVTEIPGGTPITGLDEFTDLSGVSCASSLDCTAVGDTGDMGGNVPVYTTETDGTWSAIETYATNTGEGNLTAVRCTDAADCTAVGNLSIGNTVPGWVTENGGTWGTPTEILGTPSGFGSFSGLSCSSAGSCIAVGKDNAQEPVQATETGGIWGTATEVSGALGGSGSFSAVSCTDATDCTAVGSDGAGEPIYDVDSAGVWGAPTAVPGAEGISGLFAGVSCAQTTDCTAVGVGGGGEPI